MQIFAYMIVEIIFPVHKQLATTGTATTCLNYKSSKVDKYK